MDKQIQGKFDKAAKAIWMRQYMREYRAGKRRRKAKHTPPQPNTTEQKVKTDALDTRG